MSHIPEQCDANQVSETTDEGLRVRTRFFVNLAGFNGGYVTVLCHVGERVIFSVAPEGWGGGGGIESVRKECTVEEFLAGALHERIQVHFREGTLDVLLEYAQSALARIARQTAIERERTKSGPTQNLEPSLGVPNSDDAISQSKEIDQKKNPRRWRKHPPIDAPSMLPDDLRRRIVRQIVKVARKGFFRSWKYQRFAEFFAGDLSSIANGQELIDAFAKQYLQTLKFKDLYLRMLTYIFFADYLSASILCDRILDNRKLRRKADEEFFWFASRGIFAGGHWGGASSILRQKNRINELDSRLIRWDAILAHGAPLEHALTVVREFAQDPQTGELDIPLPAKALKAGLRQRIRIFQERNYFVIQSMGSEYSSYIFGGICALIAFVDQDSRKGYASLARKYLALILPANSSADAEHRQTYIRTYNLLDKALTGAISHVSASRQGT